MAVAPTQWSLLSPDGRLEVRVELLSDGDAAAGRLVYSMTRDDVPLVGQSPLGLRMEQADFDLELSYVSASRRSVDESYTMLVGKRAQRDVAGNELTLRMANSGGDEMALIVRVHDDGAAFRYRVFGEGSVDIEEELTGFQMEEGARAYMAPYDLSGVLFMGVYEQLWRQVEAGAPVPQSSGWAMPALFEVPDSNAWVLITEADLDGQYAGTRFSPRPDEAMYTLRFPDESEGQGVGAALPTSTLPLTTPWRVMIAGDLETIVESTLVDDLSRPAEPSDTTWVRPGRAAWSWLTQDVVSDILQREYLASAVEFGWEHLLVDANWNLWPDYETAIPTLVSDAADLGVSVHLWYNSGGAHNFSTEAPRDRMLDQATRRAEMARLQQWGVAGIKVDFFESDKQDRIQQYLGLISDAADFELMVNVHGCTLPRGWQRSWPNLMTYEAVRGGEFYRFDMNPPDADTHVLYAFGRNVVGSMDYTPVVFQEALSVGGIPYIASLAQAVVFESGITHFGGRADGEEQQGYRAVFAAYPFVREFMSAVPAAWDETLLLSGDPSSHVLLARRRSSTWYLAALTGNGDAIDIEVPLRFLGDGEYQASILEGGTEPTSMVRTSSIVHRDDTLRVEVPAASGWIAILSQQ